MFKWTRRQSTMKTWSWLPETSLDSWSSMRARLCRYGNSSETSQCANINKFTRYNQTHSMTKCHYGQCKLDVRNKNIILIFCELLLTEIWPFQRLGVHFDVYSGESNHQDQAQNMVQQLQRQGLLKTSEYVMIYDGFWSTSHVLRGQKFSEIRPVYSLLD